jgi:hypothetical protein
VTVYQAERHIALGHRGDDDAHGAHVEELLECETLLAHLPIDAVDVFGAAVDFGRDVGSAQVPPQRVAHRGDVLLALRAALLQGGGDAPVFAVLEIAECEIFEFPFDLPHPEAICERPVYDAGFLRQPLALRARAGACVTQLHEVLGEPGEDQARIAHHREQHLAHGLGLLCPEALVCGPVARQPEFAQSAQRGSNVRGGGRHDACELLHRQSAALQGRAHEHRVRELFGISERTNNLSGLDAESRRAGGAFVRKRDGRGNARDRVANPLRASEYGFLGELRARPDSVSRAAI